MYVKYPRTLHLPWSEGKTRDDRALTDVSHLEGKLVVVTEKMDGENTTLYRDYLHPRSLEISNHPSSDWIKQFHARIKHKIPEDWRVCGENLFARHTIYYGTLRAWFLGFSVWNAENYSLGWEETCGFLGHVGVFTVPVLFVGVFRRTEIQNRGAVWTAHPGVEGYVVRLAREFHREEFPQAVAKWVRKDHVQTDEHWKNKPVIPNGLLIGEHANQKSNSN